VPHVVQRHGLGRVLDQVGHVVHGVDQGVDLLAVDRRDEGRVDQPVHFVRHLVRGALGVVDLPVVLLAQVHVVVVRHQLGECVGAFHHALGMLVEHFEEVAFFGEEFLEEHGSSG
jgi:hypothetical protein